MPNLPTSPGSGAGPRPGGGQTPDPAAGSGAPGQGVSRHLLPPQVQIAKDAYNRATGQSPQQDLGQTTQQVATQIVVAKAKSAAAAAALPAAKVAVPVVVVVAAVLAFVMVLVTAVSSNANGSVQALIGTCNKGGMTGGTNMLALDPRTKSLFKKAQVIAAVAEKEGLGSNGALMAIYVGYSESTLTVTDWTGQWEETTSRGIYRQLEGYAGKRAWSGQARVDTPGNWSRFNQHNAWGPGGWAENDPRMDIVESTEMFFNEMKQYIRVLGMNVREFLAADLSHDQMYALAKATQRFTADGNYVKSDVLAKVRALHAQVMGDPIDLAAQAGTVQNAVVTSTSGGVYRPTAGDYSTAYGLEGPHWANGHTGYDFSGDTGAALVASIGGKVTYAGKTEGSYDGYGPYGNMVIVDGRGPGGNEVQLLYAHLSKIMVQRGQVVQAGQKIGEVGATGNAPGGPHLHFEVKVNGERVNPRTWLENLNAKQPDGNLSVDGTAPEVGPVFIVGDSLTTGMIPPDSHLLDDVMTNIDYNVVAQISKFTIGNNSANPSGEQILETNSDAQAARTWIVALGTNDGVGSAGEVSTGYNPAINRIMELAGDRTVLWVNTYFEDRGPGWKNINFALEEATTRFPNLRVVDFASVAQKHLGDLSSDGIHWDNYRWRAELYAEALANIVPDTATSMKTCEEGLAGDAAAVGDPTGLVAEYGGAMSSRPEANIAVAAALAQVGEPYTYNARPPDTWDCSKLTAWAWGQAGTKLTAYTYAQVQQGQVLDVTPGSLDNLEPGDLLFQFNGAHHVQMYIGNGKIVEASSPSTGVRVTTVWNSWNVAHYSKTIRVGKGFTPGA